MLTKRKARKLHTAAQAAYRNGVNWDSRWQIVSAPSGADPCRIAFDSGRDHMRERDALPERGWAPYPDKLPVDVWALVYAEWLRS